MSVSFQLIQQSENSEYWNLNYDSNVAIAGFQFNIPNGTSEHYNDAAKANNLSIWCSSTFCMGYPGPDIKTIPSGNGLFLVLHNKDVTQLIIREILVSDANGNPISTSSSVQGITYADQQAAAPVININGDENVTIELGETYTDAGATANGGETVTSNSTVDTSTLGEYTVTYSATDSSNNTGSATRTVTVVAVQQPEVQFGPITDLEFGELHLFDTCL